MGSEWRWEGGAKPDGLVILTNQNQTLLSIRISAAVFLSVIVYPPTLQFVAISFFLRKARACCTFYIYSAKLLNRVHSLRSRRLEVVGAGYRVHVSNNRSNTDYDRQDLPLHSRMVNKIG